MTDELSSNERTSMHVDPSTVEFSNLKYLDASTGGFPPSEFVHVEGENIPLSEDSATLEVLFQFMRPKRHPTLALETIEFHLLEKVAEAAEKYEVFAAMNICFIRMEQALPTHPVEVLNYGAKHGYRTLIDTATPYILDLPLESVVQLLSVTVLAGATQYLHFSGDPSKAPSTSLGLRKCAGMDVFTEEGS
ncbi:hypothetical protein H0H93_008531 [Arthromyces matolae]|nr:hypothetical protein H0H93_008531 [Arthromyces matolae]